MVTFSTIFWGICMPSSCSYLDLEISLTKYFENITADSGLKVELKIHEDLCYIRDDEWMSKLTVGTKLAM
jgi:hypothetical protein